MDCWARVFVTSPCRRVWSLRRFPAVATIKRLCQSASPNGHVVSSHRLACDVTVGRSSRQMLLGGAHGSRNLGQPQSHNSVNTAADWSRFSDRFSISPGCWVEEYAIHGWKDVAALRWTPIRPNSPEIKCKKKIKIHHGESGKFSFIYKILFSRNRTTFAANRRDFWDLFIGPKMHLWWDTSSNLAGWAYSVPLIPIWL